MRSEEETDHQCRRGPVLLQDVWFLEKLASFDREVIPERRMHAKALGIPLSELPAGK